ncbi:MAG: DMT family transporter [Alphaproteobacteria bacterium]
MATSDQVAPGTPANRVLPKLTRLAVAAVFLGAFATSLSGLFVKLSELPPTATGFYRLFLSAPVLWLWLSWERPRHAEFGAPRTWRDRFELTLAASFYAINTAVWCWCMRFTSVANGQLIVNVSPVCVTLVAFIFLRERMSGSFLAGLLLTLAGIALIMGQSSALGGEHLYGDLLALVGAVFWSTYLIAIQRLRRRFSTATIMTWTAGVSSVMLLAGAVAAGERLIPETLYGWGPLLGLAFISQVAGQGLITFAIPQLAVSFTALALLIQPIYAALVAWAVLGEAPTLLQVMGGAVVLTGIALARPRRRR